MEIQKIRRQS